MGRGSTDILYGKAEARGRNRILTAEDIEWFDKILEDINLYSTSWGTEDSATYTTEWRMHCCQRLNQLKVLVEKSQSYKITEIDQALFYQISQVLFYIDKEGATPQEQKQGIGTWRSLAAQDLQALI